MNAVERNTRPGRSWLLLRWTRTLPRALTWLVLLCVSAHVGAVACNTYFPDGASNANNSAKIKFKHSSGNQILNSPDNILDTNNLEDSSNGNSCGNSGCQASGSIVPQMNYGNFPNGPDITVNNSQTYSLSPGNYDELEVKENATLILSPGVYTFKDDFKLKDDANLEVSPAGTVEVYVKKKVTFEKDVTVTSQSTGSTLFIWSKEDMEVKEDSVIEALLYSNQKLKLKHEVSLIGAATSESELEVDRAIINYQANLVSAATLGSYCAGNAAPTLNNVGTTPIAYTEEDLPIAIAPMIQIVDSDDDKMESATVTLVNGDTTEDVLTWNISNSIANVISVSYSAPTLTLSGAALKSEYRNALRSVSYSNSDTVNPTTTTRTARFTVNDGDSDSNVATRDITVTDAPEQDIDHFDIALGASAASTCQPHALVITAQNSSNATVADYDGSVTVSTSTGHGTWSYGSNSPSLPNNLGNSSAGQVTYDFAGSENGSVTLQLSNTRAESLTVVVNDASANVTSTSSTLTYAANALVITIQDSLSSDVIAGRPHLFRVEMFTQVAGGTTCALATDFSASSLHASVVRTAQLSLAGAPQILSTTIPNSPQSAAVGIQMLNGTADFNLVTGDVGQFALTLTDSSLTYSDTAITGSSSQFTVRPFGLQLSVPSNPAGATAQSAVFKSAGQSFEIQVTAKGWASADDANNDGVPDTFIDSNYSNNTLSGSTLASFGTETPNETAQLSAVSLLPASLGPVALGNALSSPNDGRIVSGFSAGTGSTTNVYYDNVGAIAIAAAVTDGNYLDIGSTRTSYFSALSEPVGRFAPAYYSLQSSSYTSACTNTQPFSYFGQTVQGAFTMQAHASTATVTTAYEGDLVKLNLSSGTKGFTARDMVATSASLSTRLSSSLGALSWSQGVGQGSSSHVFARSVAPDGPYENTSLGLQVTDSDSVSFSSGVLNLDSSADGANDSALLSILDLRHGRVRLDGGTSAPTDALDVTFRTEYFNGSGWSTMSFDSCSSVSRSDISYPSGSIDNADNLTVTVGAGQTSGSYASTTPSAVLFQQGDASHSFSAPGAGNEGSFSVNVSVASYAWLQFDWDGDGQHNDSSLPAAQYDFTNTYRGHDRVLFWGTQ
jgi:hypothetical protein